jgi:Glycine-rich domain-containing protein-like
MVGDGSTRLCKADLEAVIHISIIPFCRAFCTLQYSLNANMVAASTKNSRRPNILRPKKDQGATTAIQGKDGLHASPRLSSDLPSVDTCIIHLRLLAAFTELRESTSSQDGLFGILDSSHPSGADQRWTIFVAKAVLRFEVWLRALVPDGFQPFLRYNIASDPREMDRLMKETEPLQWTDDMLPPLDVLMVLHSYILNPHAFLEDCLRCGGVALWKVGFPWDLLARIISPGNLKYQPSEATRRAFEKRTNLDWDPATSEIETSFQCTHCSKSVAVAWANLYSEQFSQMEKGNTRMTFIITCPGCQVQLRQDSLSKARLRADLNALLKDDVVMPGTLLSVDGLIPTFGGTSHDSLGSSTVLLNKILCEGLGQQIIEEIDKGGTNDSVASALMNTLTHGHAGSDGASEKIPPALKTAARQMTAVYDRNFSPFAMDLVGAVIRQGVFIEKMRYFDWIHSPATEHTASCAVERYSGFFQVMQKNTSKTAVPTFDVDLVWHTHQMTPTQYYKYSLENCNNIFIDHDDKIVDDVLNDSFEWTCEQFAKLTGNDYDKCLCWCCAILEQESLAARKPQDTSNKKLGSQLKKVIKGLRRESEPSESEDQVIEIQTRKFENDYANERQKALETGTEPTSKKAYFHSYVWHYPMFAPHPEEVAAL